MRFSSVTKPVRSFDLILISTLTGIIDKELQSVAQKLSISNSPLYRSMRRSFALLQKLRGNHRSCEWPEALSDMVLVPAQKL